MALLRKGSSEQTLKSEASGVEGMFR
ncbi:hypothetical protein CGLO_06165 [Colletotrichum gloeosporioides Cg-14]|uniref:Uncharacterized protein n=1 Tax=Colletotrichum gloeosporioides (strain Cg-14) TaxID=1237896 RepID=T0LQT9_COLGC|nr:hypothetical protein CGLO_06165 [Colletotrichum gloeosporioides Cg-14]